MRITSILSIFIFIFICSCSESNNNTGASANINTAIQKFDNSLVSHFPDTSQYHLLSYHFYYPGSSSKSNMGVWLRARYEVSFDEIDSLVNTLSENTLTVCYPETPCNLILPKRDTINNTIEEPAILQCSEGKELTPVPSFNEELKDMKLTMLSYLPKSYVLYIVDAKSGKYIPGNLLIKDGIMPAGWEHGYSRGVAVNRGKNEVIFWIEIW